MNRLEVLHRRLNESSFYVDPASTKYHGNYEGGLAEHSYNVLSNLLDLTMLHGLKWSRPDSPVVVALCHDLCKLGAYIPDGNGDYRYNKDHPKGHGTLSVQIAREWIELTEEEELCIRWHMGAYGDKDKWNLLGIAMERYPTVLWTHTADVMATRFDEAAGRNVW